MCVCVREREKERERESESESEREKKKLVQEAKMSRKDEKKTRTIFISKTFQSGVDLFLASELSHFCTNCR